MCVCTFNDKVWKNQLHTFDEHPFTVIHDVLLFMTLSCTVIMLDVRHQRKKKQMKGFYLYLSFIDYPIVHAKLRIVYNGTRLNKKISMTCWEKQQ